MPWKSYSTPGGIGASVGRSGCAYPALAWRGPRRQRLLLAVRRVARRHAETSILPGKVVLDDAQAFMRSEIAAWAPVARASAATPG